jgi:hypothetical protein
MIDTDTVRLNKKQRIMNPGAKEGALSVYDFQNLFIPVRRCFAIDNMLCTKA